MVLLCSALVMPTRSSSSGRRTRELRFVLSISRERSLAKTLSPPFISSTTQAMVKINEAVASKGLLNSSSSTLQSSSTSFASSGASSPSGSGSQTPTTSTDRTLVDSPKLGASPLSSTFSSITLGGARSSSPHRAMSKSQTILTAGLDTRTGLPVGLAPTLSENVYNYLPKVVNYSGPTVVDPAERKRISPKHFVMLTVSSRLPLLSFVDVVD